MTTASRRFPPLTDYQLADLAKLAQPGLALVAVGRSDRRWRSLIRRGLIAPEFPARAGDPVGLGSFFSITPAGLRALADAVEAGRFDHWRGKHRRKHPVPA